MKGAFWTLEHPSVSEVPEIPTQGFRLIPHAEQYCCPKCGTVWAGFIPEKDYRSVYMFRHVNCPSCGGGSFRLFGDYPLDFLPLEALVEEINLLLEDPEAYEFRNHRGI